MVDYFSDISMFVFDDGDRHQLLHDCLGSPSTRESNKTFQRLLWITESVFEEKGEPVNSPLASSYHRWVGNLLTLRGVPGERLPSPLMRPD
jgi:hypothetical protein